METIKNVLDPRVKLIIVLSLSTTAVFIKDVYYLGGILLISITISILFNSPLLSLINKFKRMLWLIVSLIFIQSIFIADGTSIITLGDITFLTIQGIMKGLQLVLRMLIIIISASIMATNTSREIVQGLVQWRIPYEIAFMVSIAIRFLPMLTDEIRDVVIAIQLRGIELEKIPLRKRIKIYSYVLMPIVANTMVKARKLSTAMEMRGFGVNENRTSYHTLQMRRIDYTVIVITILGLTTILGQYYLQGG